MMQRLGPMPRRAATSGAHSVEFFAADGRMWHLPSRHVPYWPLDHVLQEQHGLPEEEVGGPRAARVAALTVQRSAAGNVGAACRGRVLRARGRR